MVLSLFHSCLIFVCVFFFPHWNISQILHWSFFFFPIKIIIIYIILCFFCRVDWFPDMLKNFLFLSSSSDCASSSPTTRYCLLICAVLEPHFSLRAPGSVFSKPVREVVLDRHPESLVLL